MKPISLLLIGSLLSTALAATPPKVNPMVLLRPGEARTEANGQILVPDATGNGYDLTVSSGGVLEVDPSYPVSKSKVLILRQNYALSRPEVNMPELPNLFLNLKVKPSPDATGVSELLGIGSRMILRYIAQRQLFVLTVNSTSSTQPPFTGARLELKGKPGEWNQIKVSINPIRAELRVDGQITYCLSEVPNLNYAPIPNAPVHFLRPDKNQGQFVGSVGDLILSTQAQ